jgi:two-component system, response regulator YesN
MNTIVLVNGNTDNIGEFYHDDQILLQTHSHNFIEINTEEDNYSEQDLYEIFVNSGFEFTGKFYVGLCYGVLLEPEKVRNMSYEKYLFLKFSIYKKIKEIFCLSKTGFVVKKEDSCCSLVAVIPEEDSEDFIEKYVLKSKEVIKNDFGVELQVGVGEMTRNTSQLLRTYETAKYAYHLYFFEEKDILEYSKINKAESLSFDVYEELMEELYNSIVSKDKEVFEKIENILNAIEYIHYGNKNAAINRCIMFVGELGKRLKDLNPKAANWRIKQEEKQEELRYQTTYRAVKNIIIEFYQYLIPVIYHNVDQGSVYEIVQIKEYIQKNYMQDISLKELADLTYVSRSYFSTAFKNATGKNFKSYLTEVRMEEALKLVLRTNMKTYEIAERVGYHNVRFFVDAFKNTYKMSPLEYRKLHSVKVMQKS